MSKQSTLQTLQDIELPQTVIESFARFLVPVIREYYETEEGRQAFEQWHQEQDNWADKIKREPRPKNLDSRFFIHWNRTVTANPPRK